jgi:hypothetical protein
MSTRSLSISIFSAIALLSAGGQAFGWGERGHHTVCEVATRLLPNTDAATGEFSRFMLSKSHMMGHVCNLPDISWRSLVTPDGSDGTVDLRGTIKDSRVGDQAHFINPENFLPVPKKTDGSPNTISIPLSFSDVEKMADLAKKKGQTAQDASGSNWWRTQQLYTRAIEKGTAAVFQIEDLVRMEAAYQYSFGKMSASDKARIQPALATEISGCGSDKDACLTDVNKRKDAVNESLRQMLISMALMGHFVGDAGQPFHNTADYNGQQVGQAGIHSYYEAQLVDQIPSSLQGEVYASATSDPSGNIAAIFAEKDPDPKSSKDPYNVLARMRKLSDMAGGQKGAILQLDAQGIKIAEAIKDGKPLDQGVFTPVPGSRSAPLRPFADAVGNPNDTRYTALFASYRTMIVNEIGVSSKVLATFWTEILGKVDEQAQLASARLMNALNNPKLAHVDDRLNRLDFTKFYTTFNYPLDTDYVEPTYLCTTSVDPCLGLSLKPLPAGTMAPPPAPIPAIPLLRETGEDSDEHGIDTELGDVDVERHR